MGEETHGWFWLMVSIILAALRMLHILRHRIPSLVEGCSSIAANSEGAKNIVVRCVALARFSEVILSSENGHVKRNSGGGLWICKD